MTPPVNPGPYYGPSNPPPVPPRVVDDRPHGNPSTGGPDAPRRPEVVAELEALEQEQKRAIELLKALEDRLGPVLGAGRPLPARPENGKAEPASPLGGRIESARRAQEELARCMESIIARLEV